MMKSKVKKWLRRLLYLVVILACLLLICGIALQTSPGKCLIAQSVSSLVAHYSRYSMDIDGLSGTLPQHIRITRLDIADPGGDLATIHNLDLSIDITALLQGHIHVKSLQLEHLELWKRPTPKERWRIPKFPKLPVWPTVDELLLSRITLHEAVLGTPATLTATGQVQPVPGSLFPSVALEINSVDTDDVHGKLTYTFDKEAPVLSLVVEDDTLLPTLLEVTPPVKIVMEGKGRRTDWKASFQADAGEESLASGSASFRGRRSHSA